MPEIARIPIAVIVAHPDDETLWSGGTILSHPVWDPFIVCICRASDSDRAPRFAEALALLKAKGVMGDLDDGPSQQPLNEEELKRTIQSLLPAKPFDLIITHNPRGEYTRHIRHEEVSKAVISLWYDGRITSRELWTFAYEDGQKKYLPRPVKNAPVKQTLSPQIWEMKHSLITETYGFEKDSWEARTTPKTEAFWRFTDRYDAKQWLDDGGIAT
jgi:LmbE family N-acetylglucosaminyl deacetylase